MTIKILLILAAPCALAGIATAYILAFYALAKRVGFDTGAPWFATGVMSSFVALLYLIAARL